MAVCGTGLGNFPQPGDPSNDSILSAASAFGGINVSWTYPGVNPHAVAHTELYRNTSGTEGSEVLYKIINSDHYFDASTDDTPVTYYYWIRHVSINGTRGDLIGPASAIAKPKLEDYIGLLSGEIAESSLGASLMTRLGKIDLLDLDLASEIQNRINGESLLGTELNVLQNDIDSVGVSLSQEINTRQTEYSAMLQTINNMSVSNGDSYAELDSRINLLVDENVAQGQSIDTLDAAVFDPTTGLANTYAKIQTEETVRADADTALSNRTDTLETTVSHPSTGLAAAHSRITNEETARSDADSALSQTITDLDAVVTHPSTGLVAAHAGISNEQTARVNADDALSQSITTLRTEVEDPSTGLPAAFAAIQSEETARTDADTAQTNAHNTLVSIVNDPSTGLSAAHAAIQSEQTTRADADSALTQSIDTMQSSLDHPSTGLSAAHSAIQAEATTRANEDGLLAQDINTLETSLNDPVQGLAATFAKATNAQSTADGKIESFWQASPPASASEGDIWFDTSDKNQPYRWDSTLTTPAWVSARDDSIADAFLAASNAQTTADGKITTHYSGSAPGGASIGDLWIDTSNDNQMKRWNGSTWVDVRDGTIAQALAAASNAQSTADGKINSYWGGSPPVSPDTGDLWYNTSDNNNSFVWTGSGWLDVTNEDISRAITKATDAQATADGKVTTFYSASAPTAEGVGDLWIDTDDGDKLYRWDGSQWVELDQATLPAVLSQIQDNNTTMIGYCEIGGNPDSNYTTPTSCSVAGGTWITAAPLAESVKQVSVTTNQQTASIEQLFTAHGNDIGDLLTEFTIKFDVNGYVAGFGVTNDGATSQAIFNVDNFSIGKLGVTDIQPFIVNGSEVFINDAYIDKLTFDKLRATDSSLIVENGKIKADYIQADAITARTVESVGFNSGSYGFKLDQAGHAEFNDITIYDNNGDVAFQSGVTHINSGDRLTRAVQSLTPNPNMTIIGDNGKPAGWFIDHATYDDSVVNLGFGDSAKTFASFYSPPSSGLVPMVFSAFSCIGVKKVRVRMSIRKEFGGTGYFTLYVYKTGADIGSEITHITRNLDTSSTHIRDNFDTVAPNVTFNDTWTEFTYEYSFFDTDKYASFVISLEDGISCSINQFEVVDITWDNAGDLAYKNQIDNQTYIANGVVGTLNLIDNTVTTLQSVERATELVVSGGGWGEVCTLTLPSAMVALNEPMPFVIMPSGSAEGPSATTSIQGMMQVRILAKVNPGDAGTEIYRSDLFRCGYLGSYFTDSHSGTTIEHFIGGGTFANSGSSFREEIKDTNGFGFKFRWLTGDVLDVPAGFQYLTMELRAGRGSLAPTHNFADYAYTIHQGARLAVIGMQR